MSISHKPAISQHIRANRAKKNIALSLTAHDLRAIYILAMAIYVVVWMTHPLRNPESFY